MQRWEQEGGGDEEGFRVNLEVTVATRYPHRACNQSRNENQGTLPLMCMMMFCQMAENKLFF
jgi:hypothetical protein